MAGSLPDFESEAEVRKLMDVVMATLKNALNQHVNLPVSLW